MGKKENNSKKLIVFLIFYQLTQFFTSNAKAQVFTPLNNGFDISGEVKAIFFDSTTNKLYAGGTIDITSMGVDINGIAQWNGVQWDSLNSGVTSGGWVNAISKYQSDIIIGGSFNSVDGVFSPGLAKWNGSNYSAFANVVNGGGCVYSLEVIGSDLYVGGCFTSVNGINASGLAKYNGSTWTTFPSLYPSSYPSIYDIIEYNNDLYVGGRINVPGASPPIYALAKWDGTQWQKVGTGFGSGNDNVFGMAVFQGELYVVGYFSGNPGNSIARWNGSSWSQCGSGLVGNVFVCIEYNNELYVGGIFIDAGGVSVTSFAKWDGNQWYAVPGGILHSNGGIISITKGMGDLYFGGRFLSISGTSFNSVAKYNYPVGIQNQHYSNLPITIYPTLAHDVIKFSYNTLIVSTGDIKIYNSSGTVVYHACNVGLNKLEIDVSSLPSGVYYLKAFAKDGEGGGKFIKH